MENKTGLIVGVLVAIAVVAGGVFWFINSDSEEETTNQTSTTEQAEQPVVEEQAQDIVALAIATPELSTLVTALQAADLVETLQGDGPFTVLAPTNDAFAALPEGTLDTLLLPENVDQLTAVLTYHVIAGDVMSTDLSDGLVVETVQGESLTVSIRNGSVYFVDATGGEAMVTTADVEASNGVVHIIDSVLLPQ